MKNIILILFLLFLLSCSKVKIDSEAPPCIKEKLKQNLKNGTNAIESKAGFKYSFYKIEEYEWNGKKYYLWSVEPQQIGCMQGFASTICFNCNHILMNENCEPVFDNNGKQICECKLYESGDAEQMNCKIFLQQAKKIKVIWQKK